MLKNVFKKLFKNNILNNQNGSVLSVTFAVMAVLTLSIATVTAMTVSTSQVTQLEVDKVNNKNTGENLINESLELLVDYININQSFPSAAQIDNIYLNTGIDAGTLSSFTVRVNDVTDQYAAEGYGDLGSVEIRLYRFEYTLSSGKLLVKNLHATTGAVSVETFEPFDYAIGTNGDLVLTAGYYDGLKIFTDNVYTSKIAPFYNRALNSQTKTSAVQSEEPFFDNLASISSNGVNAFCSDDSCFGTSNNQNNPITLYPSNFTEDLLTTDNPPEVATTSVVDFFGSWSFEDYYVTYLKEVGPTDNANAITDYMDFDNISTVMQNNSAPPTLHNNGKKITGLPDAAYVDLSGLDQFIDGNLAFSVYYNGNHTITDSLTIANGNFDDELALFIDGDLTIDLGGQGNKRIKANIVVNGDLEIIGDDLDVEGMLIVLGTITMDFDEGKGLITSGNNLGYSIMALDNVFINSMYEQHASPVNNDEFRSFVYTEESIFVDGVNSRVLLDGALFARATGNQCTANPGTCSRMPMINNDTGDYIEGIIITSFQGHINNSGVAVPDQGVANVDSNGFLMSSDRSQSYNQRFFYVPQWESIVVNSDGTITTYPGDFTLE